MQEKSEQSYWATVKDCLRELHSFTPTKANNQIREYRKQIEALSIESAIYHDEPYEVACDIAGVSSENRADWERYQIIRKAHFPRRQRCTACKQDECRDEHEKKETSTC